MFDVTQLPLAGDGGLLDVLTAVTDPRMRRGIRHPVRVVLGYAVCAILAGCRSLVAIGQWAHDQPVAFGQRLGVGCFGAPSEPTLRRVLGAVSPTELDFRLGAWFVAHESLVGQAIAIDGKTVRGAKSEGAAAPHLVSALLHRMRTVIAQCRVADKANEITSVEPLLRGIDIAGAVVTGDAMFAQKRIAEHLVEDKKADYLFTVKDNQPTLRQDIEALELDDAPPSGRDDR